MFNLRHAYARNVVERIFGVFKNRFRIFATGPHWSIETQAKLVQALAVVHNVIRIYDPEDLPDEDEDRNGHFRQDTDSYGTLGLALTNAERRDAESLRDGIASKMWSQYLDTLRERGLSVHTR